MFTDILLPTDSTPGVEDAIEHAIDLASQYGATLHVLYVVDSDTVASYPGDEYVHEDEGLEHALEEEGRKAVEAVAERARGAGVDVVTVLRRGVPHEEILTYATDEDVDLTILGTKQRSGEYRRLLGSVAERVARLSDRPVTIAKHDVDER